MASITLKNQFNEVSINLIVSYNNPYLLIENQYGEVTNNKVLESASSGGQFDLGYVNLLSNEGDISLNQIALGSL